MAPDGAGYGGKTTVLFTPVSKFMSLHVGLLTWGLPPEGSGLGRAALEIATSLQEAGARVIVFNAAEAIGWEGRQDGLSIIGCSPPDKGLPAWTRRLPALGHLVAPYYFRKAVHRVHRREPLDIVEATNWYAPAALLVHSPVPLVVRNSTPAIDAREASASMRDRFDLWFAHRLEARTARRAAALISNTRSHHGLMTRLYRLGGKREHTVISLALDPKTIERGAAAHVPDESNPVSLLFVGRAERRKGFEEMLRAVLTVSGKRLASRREPVALTIVGVEQSHVDAVVAATGASREAAAAITVIGSVSDDALHRLYETCTAVIAPSRYESFGLVYREAAAFARPLIACAEDPAAREFIEQAECGILAETCTEADISVAIETLLSDSSLIRRHGLAGRRHAATLSRPVLAEQTLAIYRSVLARESSRSGS